MDEKRFLDCLDADFRRLREVVSGALGEAVPTCPGWTGADLAAHVAEVYLDKARTIRTGVLDESSKPSLDAEPLAALDRAYRELTSEFAAHEPGDPAPSWYRSPQTVGWWIRRMAQETVIHRVDAELTAGTEPLPILADLAADGIDEVLVCFLAFATTDYAEYVSAQMAGCDGDTVRIATESASWLVILGPDVVTVEQGSADADAVLRGSEGAVLRWLWRRAGNSAVEIDGDHATVGKLHQLLGVATQ